MPENTTPKKTTTAPKAKGPEIVRWAYVLGDDGKTYADAVTFGTNDARTEFLTVHPTQWWRILDAPKGQSLTEALGAGS